MQRYSVSILVAEVVLDDSGVQIDTEPIDSRVIIRFDDQNDAIDFMRNIVIKGT